jgi:subtilisin family serine protease
MCLKFRNMKKILNKLGLLSLAVIVITACQDFMTEVPQPEAEKSYTTRAVVFEATDYYLFGERKIPIQKIDNKFYVLFRSADNKMESESMKAGVTLTIMREGRDYSHRVADMPNSTMRKFADTKIAAVEGSYEQVAPIFSSALYWAPYYRLEDGSEIGIAERFTVVLKPGTTLEQLEKLANENAVELLGKDRSERLSNWYHLVCTQLSKGNALEMANLFFDSGLFETAFPDFIGGWQYACINEPEFTRINGNLWHLGNSPVHIDYCKARAIISQGSSSITVAVIDDGVQSTHRDFFNVLPGWDIITNSAPNYGNRSGNTALHGTQVAGFIGAIPHNGQDVAGIAHGVTILPVSLRKSANVFPEDVYKALIYAADRARVINFSWSGSGYNWEVNEGVQYALNKGCIVVFPAGNDRPNDAVSFPANSDSRILVVGAVNRVGMRASGNPFSSAFGNTLDIVAPGVELETAIPFNVNGKPTIRDDGTSFAAPQVAATAALILSINPNLTQKQVTDIIESTATKHFDGFYQYATTPGRPNGRWHQQMGYGILNVFEAVSVAAALPRDVHFNDRTVSLTQAVSGVSIFSQNITVTSNATLTFNFSNMVTINAPFTVNAGSQLFLLPN